MSNIRTIFANGHYDSMGANEAIAKLVGMKEIVNIMKGDTQEELERDTNRLIKMAGAEKVISYDGRMNAERLAKVENIIEHALNVYAFVDVAYMAGMGQTTKYEELLREGLEEDSECGYVLPF